MNSDNLSALAVGIAVAALIAGFGVYFNSPSLNKIAAGSPEQVTPAAVGSKIDKSQFHRAPELAGISNYINSKEFKISDLKGKVVIVDFWTYSCINCIRTIPYLNAWYEKYADQGLVIVGVHTPEFDFEKNPSNIQAAVQKFGIKYPVVQDNDRATWDAYQNRYWPRKYIIDDEGYVRFDHIGEGGYAETERTIQSLLQERAANIGNTIKIDSSTVNPGSPSVDFGQVNTPELYFGYGYARTPLGNAEGFKPGQTVMYSISDGQEIRPNTIYLSGKWLNNQDNMQLQGGTGRVILDYSAKSVNIVAGGKGTLYLSEDEQALSARGADVGKDGSVAIGGQRLYNLVSHNNYGRHQLVIDATGNDFQVYTFTFGYFGKKNENS